MQQDWHLMKYSHHKTKYIGKQVGLRTYQHPCTKPDFGFHMCSYPVDNWAFFTKVGKVA